MAKDHFVPRHYLRQFVISGSTKKVAVVQVCPYRFVGRKGIGGQCQQADFEEGDRNLGTLLKTSENDLAPVLVRVVKKENFTEPELVALRWFAVILHVRTRRAAEAAKLLPKRIIHEVIKNGIEAGELPPPPEGKWTEEMVACKGAPGFLMKSVIPCVLEMQTLACKILKAPSETCFLTSDNPVVVLNQFCASAELHRNFAGFSKSGFQLLLPISPNLCLIFYDAKTYKLDSPQRRLICISTNDVELVNALQVQSAENFLYFHEPKLEKAFQNLVSLYMKLRVPLQDGLRTLRGSNQGEEILHVRQMSVKLPKPWEFCRLRRHSKSHVGDRRNPAWSALIEELMDDFEKHPNGGDMHARIRTILADPNSLKNIRVQ